MNENDSTTSPPPSKKLLAEWFWTDRWMGSSAFLLPLEPRGLYREMLTQAWRRGARLPNDHEAIMRAVGATPDEWTRCWPKIKRYWRIDGENLVNDTQIEIYSETVGRREAKQNAGKLGGKAKAERVAKELANGLANGLAKTYPPSPSPDLSLDQENVTDSVAAAPVTKKRAGKETWLTPYSEAWSERYGGPPAFGPLSAALKPVQDKHGPEKTLDHWRRYVAATDAQYASPAKFAATFGAWVPKAPATVNGQYREANSPVKQPVLTPEMTDSEREWIEAHDRKHGRIA